MNSFDHALRSELTARFTDDPEWYVVLGQKMKLMQKGAWPECLIDCIYQYSWHHEPDIFDAWVFLNVYALLDKDLAVFQIPIGVEPYPDKEFARNHAALADLPSPFRGTFVGGTQGCDGMIEWITPVHATVRYGSEIRWVIVRPHSLQLEVGTNSSGKFWDALINHGGVARWPYEQSYVTVFLNRKWISDLREGDPGFEDALGESAETIDTCRQRLDRDPWPRWNEGYELLPLIPE
jgi:hypothetical protein